MRKQGADQLCSDCAADQRICFHYLNSTILLLPKLTLKFPVAVQPGLCLTWSMRWPSGRASDSGARGQGFDPHSGRRVVSLSKIHIPPKSTGNTQEAVAPSRHD